MAGGQRPVPKICHFLTGETSLTPHEYAQVCPAISLVGCWGLSIGRGALSQVRQGKRFWPPLPAWLHKHSPLNEYTCTPLRVQQKHLQCAESIRHKPLLSPSHRV